MSTEDEFVMWRQDWQSQPAVPIELIRRVERQTAQMRTLRATEIAVTIAMGGGVLAGAVVHPVVDRIYWWVLAAGTWSFLGAAWTITVRSTRETWHAAALTTAAYVSLHVRRLRRRLDRLVFSIVCSVALGAFVLVFVRSALVHALAKRGVAVDAWDFLPFWIVGVVVNAVVVVSHLAKRRKMQAELHTMLEIEQRLRNSPGAQ